MLIKWYTLITSKAHFEPFCGRVCYYIERFDELKEESFLVITVGGQLLHNDFTTRIGLII